MGDLSPAYNYGETSKKSRLCKGTKIRKGWRTVEVNRNMYWKVWAFFIIDLSLKIIKTLNTFILIVYIKIKWVQEERE